MTHVYLVFTERCTLNTFRARKYANMIFFVVHASLFLTMNTTLYCTGPQEPGPGQNGKGEGGGCRDLPGTGSLGRKGCRCERHRGISLTVFVFFFFLGWNF